MADLGKSDATWEKFWDRFLALVALGHYVTEVRDRLSGARVKLTYVGDTGSNVGSGSIVLAGVKPRLAATERNELYVRVTGASNPYTVSLYKATGGGGGDLVAQGSGNAGATITLAEQNGSGVSGTWPLANPATADTTDGLILTVYTDWPEHLRLVFNGDEDKDADSLRSVGSRLARMEALGDQLVDEAVGLISDVLVSDPANGVDRGYGSKFLERVFGSVLSEVPSTDSSGAVARLRTGSLDALRQSMADETTGSTQTIVRRRVAAAAAVAATNNDGLGAIASHTPEDQCPTGTFRLECVQGLGTNDGGRERFRVSWASDDSDDTITFPELLTIGQAYKGLFGFGGANGITLARTFSKTGDGSNLHLASVASGWSVSGENEDNTSSGTLHWKIVADGSNWIVEFYRTALMASGDLVARSSAAATGAAFTATQSRGSGLQLSGTMGSAPVNGTTGTLLLNYHRVQNSTDGSPDAYTVAVTLTDAGLASSVLARLPFLNGRGYRLNSTTSSSELIGDGRVRANTLPQYQDQAA